MGNKDEQWFNPSRVRLIIMITFLMLLVYMVYNKQPELEKAKANRAISYEKIINDPNSCIGKDFEISGTIVELVSRTDGCTVTISVVLDREQSLKLGEGYEKNKNNQVVTKVVYKTPSENYDRFEVNDRVKIKGVIQGTTKVNKVTVPVLKSENEYDIEVI